MQAQYRDQYELITIVCKITALIHTGDYGWHEMAPHCDYVTFLSSSWRFS